MSLSRCKRTRFVLLHEQHASFDAADRQCIADWVKRDPRLMLIHKHQAGLRVLVTGWLSSAPAFRKVMCPDSPLELEVCATSLQRADDDEDVLTEA